MPVAPSGFLQAMAAPWRWLRMLMRRPFAWLRPTVLTIAWFTMLTGLCSELLANALFMDGNAVGMARARVVGNQFFPWLFMPAAVCVFLAGAVAFVGNGRLGYGLAGEPLRARTGALLGLGLASMLLGLIVAGAGRLQPSWGPVVAGLLMTMIWNPIMGMASAQIWAHEASAWSALRWGAGRVIKQWREWLGISASYLAASFLVMISSIGMAWILGQWSLPQGVMIVMGVFLVAIMLWGASVVGGLSALVVLAMHADSRHKGG